MFHLFGALAQFEREIIRDLTVAGLAAARARGRVGGRPSKLSQEQIGQALGVSRTSILQRSHAITSTTTATAVAAVTAVTPPAEGTGTGVKATKKPPLRCRPP